MSYDFEKVLKERQKDKKVHGNSTYVPEMGEAAIELMNQGKSVIQVAAALGICRDTFYRWSKDPNKPEFVKAVALGRTLAQAAHEQLMDDLIMGRIEGANKGAIVGQMYRMKCRFRDDWMDRTESKIDLNQSSQIKQATDKEIDELIKNALSQNKTK